MAESRILPVTELSKQVTDPLVLSMLSSKNIDSSYVEFKEDYNALHPYGKLYSDRKSNTQVMAVSGLPMALKTDGSLITPGFELSGDKYYLKNNLFDGFVSKSGEIRIACKNDQPTGALALDEGHWTPDLYIGGELVFPKSSTILETDPVNSNYHDNVIEIDYGVCIRRIRVIEGRFRGSWIFPQNPNGSIRIVYNNTGKLQNRLGTYKDAEGNNHEFAVPVKDEEYLDAVLLDMATYPLEIGDSATFYPDAHAETTTVDGHVAFSAGGILWANLITGNTSYGTRSATDSGTALYCFRTTDFTDTASYWMELYRGIILFNTSTLGSEATITDAVLSLTPYDRIDNLSITPDLCVFSSNPASNTALVADDFVAVGTTAYSDTISYSNWTGSYKNFTFNAAGKSAISKTGVSKFSVYNKSYDANATAPSNSSPADSTSYMRAYAAEYGSSYKPKLVVTYTVPYKSFLFDSSYRRNR